MTQKHNLPHASLWIGPRQKLITELENKLKSIWCKKSSCNTCGACKGIEARQYYSLLWLTPEKTQYSVEQLETVQNFASLTQDADTTFVIVFENAEQLSISAANKLLKTLEEPHPGYHFVLLSESEHALLDTIVSRCIISQFEGARDTHSWDDFLTIFKKMPINAFEQFAQFDKQLPTEHESIGLLNELYEYRYNQFNTTLIENKPTLQSEAMIEKITFYLSKPPMPGSSKLMWRSLLLELINIKSIK